MLDELYDQLAASEQRDRDEAFRLAHHFVDAAGSKGGVDAPVSKSFPRKQAIRVDIEVNKGRAFVP